MLSRQTDRQLAGWDVFEGKGERGDRHACIRVGSLGMDEWVRHLDCHCVMRKLSGEMETGWIGLGGGVRTANVYSLEITPTNEEGLWWGRCFFVFMKGRTHTSSNHRRTKTHGKVN